MGDFSGTRNAHGALVEIRDPDTALPFPGNSIPLERINPQAAALLGSYPQPMSGDMERVNHQVPIVSDRQQHNLQSRLTYTITPRVPLQTSINYERGTADWTTIFGFADASRSSGRVPVGDADDADCRGAASEIVPIQHFAAQTAARLRRAACRPDVRYGRRAVQYPFTEAVRLARLSGRA